MERVAIVGAGIAGDALAVMLNRAGWEVTVIELALELRSGGQIVDLRNGSSDVLDRMGLLGKVSDALIDQAGMAWVDADGRHLAQMPVEAFGGRGFVSDKELARTDLARIVHTAGSTSIRYLWGDTVTHLIDTPTGVRVTTRAGITETFDVVVGADGTHSAVRALRFGPEDAYRYPLGIAHAWFTITETATTPDLGGWFLLYNAPGSRVVGVRPGPPGTQEVGFNLPTDGLPTDRKDREARLRFLEERFARAGWRTDEFLAAARTAENFALDAGDQIRMSRWYDGGVVLLGDSAWCAAPLSGLGTALALQGAEALATRLIQRRSNATPEAAFAEYERDMRPIATKSQRLLPGRVRTFAPRSARGIRTMTTGMKVLQSRVVQTLASTALSRSTAYGK